MTEEKTQIQPAGKDNILTDLGRALIAARTDDTWNRVIHLLHGQGYVCKPADNGSRAYELSLVNDFHLVILDGPLPKMGCLETIRAIRQRDPEVYILLLCGESAKLSDTQAAIRNGADKVVLKPVPWGELHAFIRNTDFVALKMRRRRESPETRRPRPGGW